MRIEDYFAQVRIEVENALWVATSEITYDKRGTHEGYIRGQVYFIDGSILHIREFIECESLATRLIYAYHYIDNELVLVFRYDNAPHHRKPELVSFPHHKHDGSETKVVDSGAPNLAEVMNEIGLHIDLGDK